MKRWLLGWVFYGLAAIAVAQAPAPVTDAATGGAAVQAPVPVLAPQIGSIERFNGIVTVTPAGDAARPVREGDAVREGDLIITLANSETLIKLRDETTLSIRQLSQLRLVEYRFERTPADGFVANLLKGSLRKVSGLIARAQPRNVRLTTPTATIGIRGTDYEVIIVEEETPQTRAGTYDYVNDGETFLQIASGETLNVSRDETGLALAFPRPGEAVLQLIQGRPAFLRGGGFDSMMMQLSRPPMIMMPGRR
jgi:hypothetical protein